MKIDKSDLLRTPENICELDSRRTLSKLTLANYHVAIDEISLDECVPKEIRVSFETARNLALYSWFVYRFAPIAELQAYATVEVALMEKAKRCRVSVGKTPKLDKLLGKAIKHHWIKDDGFPSYVEEMDIRNKEEAALYAVVGGEYVARDLKNSQDYCKSIKNFFPSFRNAIAHGSVYLDDRAIETLRKCAEIINQLFQEGAEG